MGRWTQYDEDDYRLPEGFHRVGYDADTQCYTFVGDGSTWTGAPREHYGVMTPVSSHTLPRQSISVTVESQSTTNKPLPAIRSTVSCPSSPCTQQDFCPEDLYNSPFSENSPAPPQPSSSPLPTQRPAQKIISRFMNAVRGTTLPGVVYRVRRSLTMFRKNKNVDEQSGQAGEKSKGDEGRELKAGEVQESQTSQRQELKSREGHELSGGEGQETKAGEGQEPSTGEERGQKVDEEEGPKTDEPPVEGHELKASEEQVPKADEGQEPKAGGQGPEADEEQDQKAGGGQGPKADEGQDPKADEPQYPQTGGGEMSEVDEGLGKPA